MAETRDEGLRVHGCYFDVLVPTQKPKTIHLVNMRHGTAGSLDIKCSIYLGWVVTSDGNNVVSIKDAGGKGWQRRLPCSFFFRESEVLAKDSVKVRLV